MKYPKVLGVATLVSLALTAIAGVGPASASRLCRTTVQTCPNAWDIPEQTRITASLGSESSSEFRVEGEIEDTCTNSELSGTNNNTGGSTATAEIFLTSVTFANCTHTTTVVKYGLLQIHAENDSGGGVLTSKDLEVTIVAFGFLSCLVSTATPTEIGRVDEPTTPSADATVTVDADVPMSGVACPAKILWTGAYRVTTPTPLYVSTS
jgi:hypothetical protein